MDLGSILQTLVGTVVGGCIVIMTNWINALGEKRKSAREWYQQTYVTEGIDLLTNHFLSLELALLDRINNSSMTIDKMSPVPVEALTKTQVILDNGVLIDLIGLSHKCLAEIAAYESPNDVYVTLSRVRKTLVDCRQRLLKAIQTQVRDKFYKADLSFTLKELVDIWNELMALPKWAEEVREVEGKEIQERLDDEPSWGEHAMPYERDENQVKIFVETLDDYEDDEIERRNEEREKGKRRGQRGER